MHEKSAPAAPCIDNKDNSNWCTSCSGTDAPLVSRGSWRGVKDVEADAEADAVVKEEEVVRVAAALSLVCTAGTALDARPRLAPTVAAAGGAAEGSNSPVAALLKFAGVSPPPDP
jgi:hypothetical protein